MLILAANHNKRKEEQLKKKNNLSRSWKFSILSQEICWLTDRTNHIKSWNFRTGWRRRNKLYVLKPNTKRVNSKPKWKQQCNDIQVGKKKKEGSLVTRNSCQKGDNTDTYSNMKAWGNPNFFTLIRYYIDL